MANSMRALRLTDHGPDFGRRPCPDPAPDEALVRVTLAGICATDLELIRGYKGGYRGILGHEFVGVVEAAPGQPAWVGRRVVGEINIGCGDCDLCRSGLGKHCRTRRSAGIINHDGAFADYLILPVANLHPVPDAVPDDAAVFTEPLAAAMEILDQVHVTPSTRVYQLGPGRLGLLVAQVLAHTGCDLTVIGRSAGSLDLAAQLTGASTVAVGSAAYQRLTEHPAPVVVDVTGAHAGFFAALDLVRPTGTIVLKSTTAALLDGFDMSRLVVNEISVRGSRCGPFDAALRMLASGAVQTAPLIAARYPLEDAVAALEHARRPGVLKVLLTIQ
ncbi:MAG: alcohol dehydrogenase catalytic domain-containing protein [Caldilineaceae bacterium]